MRAGLIGLCARASGRRASAPRAAGLSVLCCCAWASLSEIATTQTQVSPAPAHNFVVVPSASDGDRTAWPILNAWCPGVSINPHTAQYVFDLPPETPNSIRAIAFRRRDLSTVPPQDVPAFTVTIEAWMAHSTRP